MAKRTSGRSERAGRWTRTPAEWIGSIVVTGGIGGAVAALVLGAGHVITSTLDKRLHLGLPVLPLDVVVYGVVGLAVLVGGLAGVLLRPRRVTDHRARAATAPVGGLVWPGPDAAPAGSDRGPAVTA